MPHGRQEKKMHKTTEKRKETKEEKKYKKRTENRGKIENPPFSLHDSRPLHDQLAHAGSRLGPSDASAGKPGRALGNTTTVPRHNSSQEALDWAPAPVPKSDQPCGRMARWHNRPLFVVQEEHAAEAVGSPDFVSLDLKNRPGCCSVSPPATSAPRRLTRKTPSAAPPGRGPEAGRVGSGLAAEDARFCVLC